MAEGKEHSVKSMVQSVRSKQDILKYEE